MTVEALDYVPRGTGNQWSEHQIEYLLSNTGFFPIIDIAGYIGKTFKVTRQKMTQLGLRPEHQGLPEALDDLECIPNGMTIRTSASGRIYKVPSSTPGIVSRTVHIGLGSWDEDEED